MLLWLLASEASVKISCNIGNFSKVLVEYLFRNIFTSPRIANNASNRPPSEINKKLVQACLGWCWSWWFGQTLYAVAISKSNFYDALNFIHDSEKIFEECLKKSHELMLAAYVSANPELETVIS